jgi:predicted nucleic acid-binding protein
MKKLYIDTSVFGGYFDEEFKKDTKPFFKKILKDKIKIMISEVLELEIYRAPVFIQNFYNAFPNELIERIELTEEIKKLADTYIKENIVGKTSKADCQHIALATVYKADVLVSWNFKHIVNLERIRGYNSINFRLGYQMTEIRTPKEVFIYE